uniref:Uncharacterized protein n=1 Tax=Cryptomonas curvata TaxID=233186 RepID=A0A7S0LXF1_9CRYP|mmetsp:Transcript_14918/g.31858  ORF Transcript_14918/g.31858 Transcript_14918/m.31858 type:complete len:160 (+) Transcript_14918:145-624(+)|eukprot:CAMPEP_0172167254 /NCGR_PEP_ID=MMETSP1050-20130122/9469_1 /TAXON_ID=233186 /ORGANISM="Cryptomonas curvata, Strain CCAP979/52" /LENGTH=159 /DNA_ID=CAMNT_0012838023 /DNA_START=144 /DNA_END=623 /DNA_ORIENTATION=+
MRMISSILSRIGWRQKCESDELSGLIREYIEAQPPLALNSCFCSSEKCKFCEMAHQQIVLSRDRLSTCESTDFSGGHSYCEDHIGSSSSESVGDYSMGSEDEMTVLWDDGRSMLQRWLHELPVQVELEPCCRALCAPFSNHPDSDPTVDDNPNFDSEAS